MFPHVKTPLHEYFPTNYLLLERISAVIGVDDKQVKLRVASRLDKRRLLLARRACDWVWRRLEYGTITCYRSGYRLGCTMKNYRTENVTRTILGKVDELQVLLGELTFKPSIHLLSFFISSYS